MRKVLFLRSNPWEFYFLSFRASWLWQSSLLPKSSHCSTRSQLHYLTNPWTGGCLSGLTIVLSHWLLADICAFIVLRRRLIKANPPGDAADVTSRAPDPKPKKKYIRVEKRTSARVKKKSSTTPPGMHGRNWGKWGLRKGHFSRAPRLRGENPRKEKVQCEILHNFAHAAAGFAKESKRVKDAVQNAEKIDKIVRFDWMEIFAIIGKQGLCSSFDHTTLLLSPDLSILCSVLWEIVLYHCVCSIECSKSKIYLFRNLTLLFDKMYEINSVKTLCHSRKNI